MSTLYLTLKSEWFDMIASGYKLEEYRDIKPYWIKRFLTRPFYDDKNPVLTKDMIKRYERIEFRNGYSKNARKMVVKWHGLSIGQPLFKWSGIKEREPKFIIDLGHIISKNY